MDLAQSWKQGNQDLTIFLMLSKEGLEGYWDQDQIGKNILKKLKWNFKNE